MSDRSKSSAGQLLQLAGEQRLVPGAEFGQLVVGDTVGFPLLLGQVVEHDHRRLGQPELRGRQDAAVAGDHLAVARHQHRYRPAELRHRPRSSRPGRPHASWRSAHRASGARAASARCAPERSSGSCPVILSGGGADSGGWIPALDSTGPRWTPSGSGGSHPRKGARLCFIGRYQASSWIPDAGWLPKKSRLSLANWRA